MKRLLGRVIDIRDLRRKLAAIPRSPAAERAMNAESFGEFLDEVSKNPVSVIGTIVTESLPALLVGAALGAAGGAAAGIGGVAVGVGGGSAFVEYGISLLDALEKVGGVDLGDPDAVMAAFQDPDLMKQVSDVAEARAAIIGIADGLGAVAAATKLVPGIAGKAIAGAAISGLGEEGARRASGLGSDKDTAIAAAGGPLGMPGKIGVTSPFKRR